MGHLLIDSKGHVVALVIKDCYGRRVEIGKGQLMGSYSPEQILAMRQQLPRLTRQQSTSQL